MSDKLPILHPYQQDLVDLIKRHSALEGEVLAPGELSDQEKRDRLREWPRVEVIFESNPSGLNWLYDRYMRSGGLDSHTVILDVGEGIHSHIEEVLSQKKAFQGMFVDLCADHFRDMIPLGIGQASKSERLKGLQNSGKVPGTLDMNPSGDNRRARRAKAKRQRGKWNG